MARAHPCHLCWKLSPAEARVTYPCWDDAKCHRRRSDAKHQQQRVERHKANHRVTSLRRRIRELDTEGVIEQAAQLNRTAEFLRKHGLELLDPDEPLTADLSGSILLLRHLSGRLFENGAMGEECRQVREALAVAIGSARQSSREVMGKGRLAAVATLYTLDGTKSAPGHAITLELWNAKRCLQRLTHHTLDLTTLQIRQWITETLNNWKLSRLAETYYRPARDCPLRPCPAHYKSDDS